MTTNSTSQRRTDRRIVLQRLGSVVYRSWSTNNFGAIRLKYDRIGMPPGVFIDAMFDPRELQRTAEEELFRMDPS